MRQLQEKFDGNNSSLLVPRTIAPHTAPSATETPSTMVAAAEDATAARKIRWKQRKETRKDQLKATPGLPSHTPPVVVAAAAIATAAGVGIVAATNSDERQAIGNDQVKEIMLKNNVVALAEEEYIDNSDYDDDEEDIHEDECPGAFRVDEEDRQFHGSLESP